MKSGYEEVRDGDAAGKEDVEMKKSLCGHGIASDCGALTVVSESWLGGYAVQALQDMSVSMCQVPSSATRMRHFGTSTRTSWRLGKAASGYLWLESVAGAY